MLVSRSLVKTLILSGLFGVILLSFNVQAQSEAPPDKPKGVNLWMPGDPGERLFISGWVHDSDQQPISGATLRIWQADGNGMYHQDRYRTLLTTDEDGRYGFGTVIPGQYSSMKHIHMIVSHQNYPSVETMVLFIGDPNVDETTQRERAIFLEKTTVEGETVSYGRFDVEMKSNSGI